jgi:hypothetical protein
MKYLLDANTFIEAKNRYYNMTVCPAYWLWILQRFAAQDVASIAMVGDELKKGDDELAAWARDNADLFITIHDEDTQICFATVANLVMQKGGEMKPGAVEEFLSGADPWLIAKAMATGAAVVTHESYNPEKKKKFLIPNVCEAFGVAWMNTFDMLYKLEARFVLPV